MINWFNIPDEGLSNGGLFEVKELEVTENGTYETKGEMYNKVTVNVEGGGGSSDFSTAEVSFNNISQSTPYSIGIIYLDVNNISYSIIEIPPEGATKVIPLYKGRTVIPLTVENVDISILPTSSGGVAIDEDFLYLTITGNGTFTAKGKQ